MDGWMMGCDGLRCVAMCCDGCRVTDRMLNDYNCAIIVRIWPDGGVIQKPTSYYMHYAACASSSSHRTRTHGSVGKRHVSKSKVSGSNPTSGSCETPQAGIAQRQSVYNIVGRTHRLHKSERLMVIAS